MLLRLSTALALCLAAQPCLAASGFFNMPTTLPQCLGVGFGPGYHAPMVMKPYYLAWNEGKGIVRANPHRFPPIYHTQAAIPYDTPATLGYNSPSVQRYAPAQHYAPAQPIYHTAPAPTPMFDAPKLTGEKRSAPAAEEVRGEPTSPSDAVEPDELPIPRN